MATRRGRWDGRYRGVRKAVAHMCRRSSGRCVGRSAASLCGRLACRSTHRPSGRLSTASYQGRREVAGRSTKGHQIDRRSASRRLAPSSSRRLQQGRNQMCSKHVRKAARTSVPRSPVGRLAGDGERRQFMPDERIGAIRRLGYS